MKKIKLIKAESDSEKEEDIVMDLLKQYDVE